MVALSIQNRGAFLKMQTDAAALDEDIKRVIKDMGREYQNIIRAELSRPKSGIFYGTRTNRVRFRAVRKRVQVFGGKTRTVTRRVQMKSGTVKSWRASRPGEAPAVFTGNLLRALRVSPAPKLKGYGLTVSSPAKLAGKHRSMLELGTGRFYTGKGNSKRGAAKTHMRPRPIWTPMQAQAVEDLERRLLRVIDASAAFRG